MFAPPPSRLWRALFVACLGAGLLFAAAAAPADAAQSFSGPTWSVLSPPTPGPALRGAAAAYDGANGTVVVFGGRQPDGSLSNRTWVWNGTTWSVNRSSPYSPAPPARLDASLAYDAALNQLILFGGEGAGGVLLDDTWLWNGETWIEVNAPTTPGARADAALAPDPDGRLVLFGGYGTSNATPTTPPVTTTTTVPPTSTSSTTTPSTTVPSSSTTTSASTVPANTSGASIPPTAGSTLSGPAAGTSAGAATNVRSRQVSGRSAARAVLDDTWLLESTSQGDDWIPVQTPVHPVASLDASMVSEGGRTILFGGTTSPAALPADGSVPGGSILGSTWSWSGSSWQLLRTAGAPPARAGAVAVDDTAVGAVVVFGGDGSRGLLDDVWALNGVAWRRLATSPPPAARLAAVGVYDTASRQLVLLGGAGVGGRAVIGTVVLTATPPVQVSTNPSPTTTTLPRKSRHHTGTGSSGASASHPAVVTSAAPRPPAEVHPGDVVTLSGDGFAPHAVVRITFGKDHRLVAVTTANASGGFHVDVTVPDAGNLGTHDFEATGDGPNGPVRLLTPVRVASFTTPSGPSTAATFGLLALAVAVPVATLLAMDAAGRMRRRVAAG